MLPRCTLYRLTQRHRHPRRSVVAHARRGLPLSTIEVERVRRVRLAVWSCNRPVDTPIGYVSPGFEVADLYVWGFTAKLLDVTLGWPA